MRHSYFQHTNQNQQSNKIYYSEYTYLLKPSTHKTIINENYYPNFTDDLFYFDQ